MKRCPRLPLFFSVLETGFLEVIPSTYQKAEYAMQLELSFYWKMSKSYIYNTGSEMGTGKVSSPHFINKPPNAWEACVWAGCLLV